MTKISAPCRATPDELLRTMLGDRARFRQGQLECIRSLVDERARSLVVQKTGWGKSLVYFIATRLLRDQGRGVTVLISPLLSLMRNQIAMAERIGIRAHSINSTNPAQWDEIEDALHRDEVDVLLVSPERLGNQRFIESTMPAMRRGIGLFVVDEAHCISDWGHDFRPDYRRIVRIIQALPATVPVLATTATANERVIEDIRRQLGTIAVSRGPLARESLRIQALQIPDPAVRLAWLAENLPRLPGSGIVYTLTVHDSERVAAWLTQNGIAAEAYNGPMDNERRIELEERLLRNDIKALVATVALGMGFDKPDIGFVVHYQRPPSAIAYYQQIGRAGRAVERAYAILLEGEEDDEIAQHFIATSFPSDEVMSSVVSELEKCSGARPAELRRELNIGAGVLKQALLHLEIDGAVTHDRGVYSRTPKRWRADTARARDVTRVRERELERMREFVQAKQCLMQFLQRELDDPTAMPCGRCANCKGRGLKADADEQLVNAARVFLNNDAIAVEPHRRWPAGVPGRKGAIPEPNEGGRALSRYNSGTLGKLVKSGKYETFRLADELVSAAAHFVSRTWRPEPSPEWVTCVPSLRHPVLVSNFALRLSRELGLPYRECLVKTFATPEQKLMHTSAHQVKHLLQSLRANAPLPGPVLLVDDMVDSGWTFTVCGALLRDAGSGPVLPFALASTKGTRDA